MKAKNLVLLLGCAAALVGAAEARPKPPPRAYMTDTRSWIMTAPETGRTYQISVALPADYSKTHAPYPVLYVTDANAEFGLAVETARLAAFVGQIPGLVIVGIGYPNPGQGFRASLVPRAFDLTPGTDPSAKSPSGGAPAFLSFLRKQLIPRIEHNYNVSRDRALVGHSFGGLFATYVLFHNDGLFGRFLIASPSLWWNSRESFAMEQAQAASGTPLAGRVFLSAGALEETTASHPMVSDMTQFAQQIAGRHYPALALTSHVFEDETHVSVIGAAFSRGLRYIYAAGPEGGR